MSVSITLFKTGLSLTSQVHTHFISFSDISISKDGELPIDPKSNPPLGTDLQAHGIIGLVELGPGYLILIIEQETVFQFGDVEIKRILKSLVIPLKYELCKAQFNFKEDDGIEITSDSTNSSVVNGGVVSKPVSVKTKELVDQMKKNKDIMFSRLGIYADDLKSSASLTICKRQAHPNFSDDFINNDQMNEARSSIEEDFSDSEGSSATGSSSYKMQRSITLRRPTLSSNTLTAKQSVGYKDISRCMLKKFTKQLRTFFDSKDFYYSDQIDLTNSISFQDGKIGNEPINKGKAFWYNRFMTKRFQSFNRDSQGTPQVKKIIQGFVNSIALEVGIEHTTHVEEAQILLVSKRSVKRPGLRYLRRGIDDYSNVANFVHTSQILLMKEYYVDKDEPVSLFCKYDIIRGSLPLFFSQNPSSLKPVPYLTKSLENPDTTKAFNEHFKRLKESYNNVSCVSLVERSKREAEVGEAFEKLCLDNGIKICWFDFHKVCAGMKFDNVIELLDTYFTNSETTVEEQLLNNGYSDSLAHQTQNGVFRVNCIDCLDRTNLVSKFLSEYVLTQLIFKNHALTPQDPSAFQKDLNNLWADNGDFISRQYAGTNALKGDYTRTSKRNYKGLMQDAWLTMNRYYSGYVSDYFKHCVIEYLVGSRGNEVFVEFERSFDVKDCNVGNEMVENKRRTAIIEELKLNDKAVSHVVLIAIYHGFESSLQVNELGLGSSKNNSRYSDDVWIVLTNKSVYLISFDCHDEIKDLIKLNNHEIEKLQYGVYFKNGGGGHHFDSAAKKPERNTGLKFILKDDEKTLETPESDGKQERFFAVKFPQDMEYEKTKQMIDLFSKTLTSSCVLEVKDILALKDAARLNTFNEFVDGIEYKFKRMIWG